MFYELNIIKHRLDRTFWGLLMHHVGTMYCPSSLITAGQDSWETVVWTASLKTRWAAGGLSQFRLSCCCLLICTPAVMAATSVQWAPVIWVFWCHFLSHRWALNHLQPWRANPAVFWAKPVARFQQSLRNVCLWHLAFPCGCANLQPCRYYSGQQSWCGPGNSMDCVSSRESIILYLGPCLPMSLHIIFHSVQHSASYQSWLLSMRYHKAVWYWTKRHAYVWKKFLQYGGTEARLTEKKQLEWWMSALCLFVGHLFSITVWIEKDSETLSFNHRSTIWLPLYRWRGLALRPTRLVSHAATMQSFVLSTCHEELGLIVCVPWPSPIAEKWFHYNIYIYIYIYWCSLAVAG